MTLHIGQCVLLRFNVRKKNVDSAEFIFNSKVVQKPRINIDSRLLM